MSSLISTFVGRTRASALTAAILVIAASTAAFAATGEVQRGYAENSSAATTGLSANCTYTQGFWKNKPEKWPVSNLTLGSVNYTKAQLLSIFNQSVQGNGLISLAHQLIAAKLNLAQGADPTDVVATIVAADALIGALVVPPVGSGYIAPATTSPLTEVLDDFNQGDIGPGHCGEDVACCYPNGECKDTPPEDCTNEGGTSQGGNTKCDTTTCTPPPRLGACCLPQYICIEEVNEAECIRVGGTWYEAKKCEDITCVNASESKSWGRIKGLYR